MMPPYAILYVAEDKLATRMAYVTYNSDLKQVKFIISIH